MTPEELEERVAGRLRDARSACVAVSGGVDSSVVLALTARTLGAEHVVAVTASAPVMVPGEEQTARGLAAALGVAHVGVTVPLMDEPGFVANPRERCYVCKALVLDAVQRVAGEHGCEAVLDGVNRDDLGDERPGLRAAAERDVRHPLLEAGLGKQDVRRLARALGLKNWDAPAQACLASRIPYGERITEEALRRIAAAEQALRELGFRACRVRAHGLVARVEVPRDEIGRAAGAARDDVARRLRALGFTYVTLDLDGLRTGSMNEAPREAEAGAAEAPPGAAEAPPGAAGVVP